MIRGRWIETLKITKMRFRIFLLCALFLGTFSGKAQIGLEFGPTLGLNSTWIVNPNTIITHQDIRPELTLTAEYGAQGALKLGRRFAIGSGFSIGKLSQRYDWNEDTLSIISLETFNIPVFLRVGNRFFSETGVQITAYNKGYLTVLDELEEDVYNTFRDNNIYLFQGLGVSIHLSPNLFFNLYGRFGYGLRDIRGVTPQGFDYETLDEIANVINSGGEASDHPQYEAYQEYIGYFDTAQDFANSYDRLNKTNGFFLTATGSLVFNLQKSKGSDK